jgi:hypothetical protein
LFFSIQNRRIINFVSHIYFQANDCKKYLLFVLTILVDDVPEGRLLQRGKQVFPDFTSSCQRVWFGAEEKKDEKAKVVVSSIF